MYELTTCLIHSVVLTIYLILVYNLCVFSLNLCRMNQNRWSWIFHPLHQVSSIWTYTSVQN
jgi:hypothetical protein